MEHRYLAERGSRLSTEAVNILGERFVTLAERDRLTPEEVVNDARPDDSPIHPYFEWDDSVAAEKWRREQAGFYLRTIEVIPAEQTEPVRAFHVVTVKRDGETLHTYKPFAEVVSNREWLKEIIDNKRREMVACQRQLRQYNQFTKVVQAVQVVIDELDRIPA